MVNRTRSRSWRRGVRAASTLLIGVMLTLLAPSQRPAVAQDAGDGGGGGGFAVCPSLAAGAGIDIVILMDVSRSLIEGPGGRPGSDPSGVRFEAVQRLVDGLAATAGTGQPPRNIAAVTFGGSAVDVVPFVDGVTTSNASSVWGRIRDESDPTRLPIERTKYTNYVAAVGRATELFATRPAANCRVLVWFTDGVHDPSDDRTDAADEADSGDLLRDFCGPSGLDKRLRSLAVAPFVLFLEPDPGPAYQRRLAASLAVMRAITGDPDPGFGSVASTAEPSCAVSGDPQVGEVLPAAEADRLVGLLGDLANAIDGGIPATPEACPYLVPDVASHPLPDSRLIEWISLASYDAGRTVTVADLTVVSPAGVELPAGVLRAAGEGGEGSIRVAVDPARRDELTAGWSIRVQGSDDLCLRVRPVRLRFEVSSRPSARPLEPADLPARLYDGRLSLVDRAGTEVALARGVVIPPGASGRLAVEQGRPILPQGWLPAEIVVVGAPLLCDTLVLPDPATLDPASVRGVGLIGDELRSAPCAIEVPTEAEGEVVIDAAAALASLRAQCDVGLDWELHVLEATGVAGQPPELRLGAGGAATLVLRTVGGAPRGDVDCTGADLAPVEVRWQGTSTPIDVAVTVAIAAEGDLVLTILITLLAVVVAALLSLLLLRVLNAWWVRPPVAAELRAYEVETELVAVEGEEARLAFPGGSFAFDQEGWRRVEAIAGPGLSAGGVRLVRRMPSMLRPWQEPVLHVLTRGTEEPMNVVATPFGHGVGTMPCGFRQAVVLAASEPRSARRPTSGLPTRVRLTVFVPSRGAGSGREEVERLVRERTGDLTKRLVALLPERREPRTVVGGAGEPVGPPTGPQPPRPPGPGAGGGTRSRPGAPTTSAPSGPTGPGGPAGPGAAAPPAPSGDAGTPGGAARPPRPPGPTPSGPGGPGGPMGPRG